MEVIKGYKVFNPDWTAQHGNFQYEVGKEYHINDDIDPREKGFYFCEKLVQCFDHCDFTHQIKAAEVEGFGRIKREFGEIYCSHIRILREIPINEISKLVNNGEDNIGTCNCGDRNRGNCNQGNDNEGNGNQGNCNRGNYNRGNNNQGDNNRGDDNRGDDNRGDNNQGDGNQGDGNQGNYNTGDYNIGEYNTGIVNLGVCNQGNGNIGIGNRGNNIIGLFCEQKHPFYLFDKPCSMSLEKFRKTKNYALLLRLENTDIPQLEWEEFTDKQKQTVLTTENITPEILKRGYGIDVNKCEEQ